MSNMSRITIKVERVVEKANAMLAASEDDRHEARRGVAGLVESILFETHRYGGFSYLPSQWKADGSGLRPDYDDTRRVYYTKAAS